MSAFLAACGVEGGSESARQRRRWAHHGPGERGAQLRQLAPVHRPGEGPPADDRRLHQGHGHPGQLQGDHPGQRELLRNDPGAPRQRPADRVGHHRRSPTGWSRRWPVSGIWRSSTIRCCPTSRRTPARSTRTPSTTHGNAHSIPWQSGITGIGYNPELTGREITSFERPLRSFLRGQGRDVHGDA